MSIERGIRLIRGEPGTAFGLTWVPEDAVRVLTWQDRGADPAEILGAVAAAMGLDVVVVPAGESWSARAVAHVHAAGSAALWAVSGVLGRVALIHGWGEVLRRSASEPGALAFSLSETLHAAMDDARAGLAAGADAVIVADDLAGSSGWLVSPDFAFEALVPCYRKIAAVVGAPIAFHSDGDVRAVYPALARAGFSAAHIAVAGEAAIAASFDAARAAGLTPMGGIEAAGLLSRGARHVGERAAALAVPGHPTLLCDDGGLAHAEEIAAYVSAVEAARRTEAAGSTDASDDTGGEPGGSDR